MVSMALNCGFMSKYRERDEKPVFIHEVVGDDIDDIERQTYALFPNVDGFVKAVLYEYPRGGYEWEIFTGEAKLVARNADPQTVLILENYIERYEEILESRVEFETDWSIVDYDALGQPITQKEVVHVIAQLKKRKGRGMLGCAVGGCLSGALLGALLTFETQSMGTGHAFPGMEVSKDAVIIGGVLGGVVGLCTSALILRTDAQQAIKVIKEGRKPREIN
jgi:hypothetical protein